MSSAYSFKYFDIRCIKIYFNIEMKFQLCLIILESDLNKWNFTTGKYAIVADNSIHFNVLFTAKEELKKKQPNVCNVIALK